MSIRSHSTIPPEKATALPGEATNFRSGIEVRFGDPLDVSPCELLPEEAFDGPGESATDRAAIRRTFGFDEKHTGPNSSAVRSRFFSCTAGWPEPPTPGEFYRAVRDPRPSPRARAVLHAWVNEATDGEIVRAWIEEAYSWRELVAAVHRIGHRRNRINRLLNRFARARPDED